MKRRLVKFVACILSLAVAFFLGVRYGNSTAGFPGTKDVGRRPSQSPSPGHRPGGLNPACPPVGPTGQEFTLPRPDPIAFLAKNEVYSINSFNSRLDAVNSRAYLQR
jgi:hypothetical protein